MGYNYDVMAAQKLNDSTDHGILFIRTTDNSITLLKNCSRCGLILNIIRFKIILVYKIPFYHQNENKKQKKQQSEYSDRRENLRKDVDIT